MLYDYDQYEFPNQKVTERPYQAHNSRAIAYEMQAMALIVFPGGPGYCRAVRINLSSKSGNSIPTARAICGKRLVWVIPGRVFTSRG